MSDERRRWDAKVILVVVYGITMFVGLWLLVTPTPPARWGAQRIQEYGHTDVPVSPCAAPAWNWHTHMMRMYAVLGEAEEAYTAGAYPRAARALADAQMVLESTVSPACAPLLGRWQAEYAAVVQVRLNEVRARIQGREATAQALAQAYASQAAELNARLTPMMRYWGEDPGVQ